MTTERSALELAEAAHAIARAFESAAVALPGYQAVPPEPPHASAGYLALGFLRVEPALASDAVAVTPWLIALVGLLASGSTPRRVLDALWRGAPTDDEWRAGVDA